MKIVRTGIILITENYEACVAFYRDLFGLQTLFEEQQENHRLTCFEYYGSYLMVETGGSARPGGKSLQQVSTKLRFNVPDIDEALSDLEAFGIKAKINRNDWGCTIDIHDPDGNPVGIRDEKTFGG